MFVQLPSPPVGSTSRERVTTLRSGGATSRERGTAVTGTGSVKLPAAAWATAVPSPRLLSWWVFL
jgi:hypothetical protein